MQRGVAAQATRTFPTIAKLKISKATSYNNLAIFYLLGVSFLRQNLPTILKFINWNQPYYEWTCIFNNELM